MLEFQFQTTIEFYNSCQIFVSLHIIVKPHYGQKAKILILKASLYPINQPFPFVLFATDKSHAS